MKYLFPFHSKRRKVWYSVQWKEEKELNNHSIIHFKDVYNFLLSETYIYRGIKIPILTLNLTCLVIVRCALIRQSGETSVKISEAYHHRFSFLFLISKFIFTWSKMAQKCSTRTQQRMKVLSAYFTISNENFLREHTKRARLIL